MIPVPHVPVVGDSLDLVWNCWQKTGKENVFCSVECLKWRRGVAAAKTKCPINNGTTANRETALSPQDPAGGPRSSLAGGFCPGSKWAESESKPREPRAAGSVQRRRHVSVS